MVAELMALLIEVTSIGVAGKQLKEPVSVPRPKDREAKRSSVGERDAAFKKGIAVLAATSKAVSQ